MALLFLAFNLTAQKIEWGTKNEAKTKWYSPYILMEDDEASVYTTYFDDNNIVIEKHNSKGNVVYSNILKLEKIKDEKPQIEDIEFLKDRFVLFVSTYDDKNEKAILYALSYSGKTGKQIGKEKKLFDAPVEKKKRKGSFYLFVSKDQTKILINHYAFYKSEGKLKDRYKLFDNEMNELMEKNEVINKKELDYTTHNYIIDNDGSVYFLRKMESGETFIVSFDATKDFEKWEEPIDVSKLDRNQSVGFVKFAFDNNNDLVIAGICVKKEKDTKSIFKIEKINPVGAMYMKVDRKSKEVKVMKIHTFKIESIMKKDDYTFTSQSMHFTANNDLVFISEMFKVQYTKNANILYDGELVIAKFDAEGELGWSNMIPKMQVSILTNQLLLIAPSGVNRHYFTYTSGVNSNNLFVIYNDDPKNLKLKPGKGVKPIKKYNKTIPFLCTIDLATGKMATKQFFDPKVVKNYIKTMVRYQKDYKSDIITIAQNKGIYQIARIKLNGK